MAPATSSISPPPRKTCADSPNWFRFQREEPKCLTAAARRRPLASGLFQHNRPFSDVAILPSIIRADPTNSGGPATVGAMIMSSQRVPELAIAEPPDNGSCKSASPQPSPFRGLRGQEGGAKHRTCAGLTPTSAPAPLQQNQPAVKYSRPSELHPPHRVYPARLT